MKTLVIFLIATFIANTATAQDYTRYRLPVGRRLVVSGETFEGFDLVQYELLLQMDEDLRYYTSLVPHLREQLALQEATITDLRALYASAVVRVASLNTERDRLVVKWREENEARLNAENSINWGSWVGWALAAVLGATTLGFSVAFAAK